MIRTLNKIAVTVGMLMLGGCVTTGSTPTAVCDALIGPIHYNSKVTTSPSHAGPALAPELAKRNRVGINLGCTQYR